MGQACVLLVDDDLLFIRSLQRALNGDVDLHIAMTTHDALSTVAALKPDVLVIDPMLSDAESGVLLDRLRASWCGPVVNVICLSRGAGALTRYESSGGGFFGMVRRDAGTEEVCAALRVALSSDLCTQMAGD